MLLNTGTNRSGNNYKVYKALLFFCELQIINDDRYMLGKTATDIRTSNKIGDCC